VALLARPLPPQSKNVVPLCRVNRSACTAARSRFSLRTFGFYVVEFQSLALLARLFHTLAVQQRAKEQVTAEPTSCQQKACGHSFFALVHAVCEEFNHGEPSCPCAIARVDPGKGLRRMEIWLITIKCHPQNFHAPLSASLKSSTC